MNFAGSFILRGHDAHIDFLRLLFLVGMICPLMQEHFLLPLSGKPNDNFRKNICSEDDLSSRIFETFVVKFLACLPLLGFSNI